MDFDTLFPVAYFLLLGILYAIGKYFEKRHDRWILKHLNFFTTLDNCKYPVFMYSMDTDIPQLSDVKIACIYVSEENIVIKKFFNKDFNYVIPISSLTFFNYIYDNKEESYNVTLYFESSGERYKLKFGSLELKTLSDSFKSKYMPLLSPEDFINEVLSIYKNS